MANTPATVGDVAQILAVLADAYAPFVDTFRPTALTQTPASVAAHLPQWMVSRASAGADVTSCVRHYPEDDYYTFCFLATRRDSQGQGLGSAMVDAVIRQARGVGARHIRVGVRSTLTRNVGFFTRRGFRYLAPLGTGSHDLYQLDIGA